MARRQIIQSGGLRISNTPGVLIPLSLTDIWVKSVQITANPSNTDFVYVGGAGTRGNPMEPRRTCEITGDDMDNGTSAVFNLRDVWIDVGVSGEGVSYIYLEGV